MREACIATRIAWQTQYDGYLIIIMQVTNNNNINKITMTKLIFDFEQVLKQLFKINNQLDKLELDYDEDLICNLKMDFVNRYRLILTKDQEEYIYNI